MQYQASESNLKAQNDGINQCFSPLSATFSPNRICSSFFVSMFFIAVSQHDIKNCALLKDFLSKYECQHMVIRINTIFLNIYSNKNTVRPATDSKIKYQKIKTL